MCKLQPFKQSSKVAVGMLFCSLFFLLLIIKNNIPSIFFHSELFCKITSVEEWILSEHLAQCFFVFVFKATQLPKVLINALFSNFLSDVERKFTGSAITKEKLYLGDWKAVQIIMFENYSVLPTELRKCRHMKTWSFVITFKFIFQLQLTYNIIVFSVVQYSR